MRSPIAFAAAALLESCAPVPAPTPAGPEFAAVPGGEIRYRSEGAGPPLVLLHAGGADMTMWEPVISRLTSERRVIRWDARGHGRSTAPAGARASTAEDLRLLLDRLGIDRATVAGISMGGGTAAQFAIRYPHRVERLVLISTSGPPAGAPPRPGVPSPDTAEGRRLLSDTGIPLLVVIGAEDSERVRAAGAAMAREIPGARLVRIDGAGHDPIAVAPQRISCLLLDPAPGSCAPPGFRRQPA